MDRYYIDGGDCDMKRRGGERAWKTEEREEGTIESGCDLR